DCRSRPPPSCPTRRSSDLSPITLARKTHMKLQVANEVQAYFLDNQTVPGTLCHAEGDKIRCVACGHRCLIGEGKRGICKVRFNQDRKSTRLNSSHQITSYA